MIGASTPIAEMRIRASVVAGKVATTGVSRLAGSACVAETPSDDCWPEVNQDLIVSPISKIPTGAKPKLYKVIKRARNNTVQTTKIFAVLGNRVAVLRVNPSTLFGVNLANFLVASPAPDLAQGQ